MEISQLLVNKQILETESNLEPVEISLFSKVREVISNYHNSIQVRVAGGWVRDKLLGVPNQDIDLVVEGTSCATFSSSLSEFYPNSKQAYLEAKPDQHKFVATTRLTLFKGFDLDICELRNDPNSPPDIPQVASDALRRDFSINALFYNVGSKTVEDYAHGIEDLSRGLIRCPISTEVNIGDDPLRILRAIRFGARYNFSLDPSFFSIPSPILNSFAHDIARDRMGQELFKILRGPNVENVAIWLHDTGIWSTLFDFQGVFNLDADSGLLRTKRAIDLFNSMKSSPLSEMLSETEFAQQDIENQKQQQMYVFLSAVFLPVDLNLYTSDPTNPKKKIQLAKVAVSRNMMISLDFADAVEKLVAAAKGLPKENDLERVSIGLWLKKVGKLWPLVRTLVEDVQYFDQRIIPFVLQNGLDGVWNMKLLLNGKDLIKLHGIKPGPQVGEFQNKLFIWQLKNPEGTAEEYIATINV